MISGVVYINKGIVGLVDRVVLVGSGLVMDGS